MKFLNKILLCLVFGLMACSGDEIEQTCGPTPNTYFDTEGNEITSCTSLNFCNNPPTVFDATGNPVECDEQT